MAVWTVPATILRWVDADTADCSLDVGFAISYRAKVRVEHVNAAEIRTPDGQAALAWTQAFIPAGTQVIVESRRWDKYGRVLGTLKLPSGRDYGEELIKAGHAVPYEC